MSTFGESLRSSVPPRSAVVFGAALFGGVAALAALRGRRASHGGHATVREVVRKKERGGLEVTFAFIETLELGPAAKLEDPSAALRQPTVTLYGLQQGQAIFVETPADMDVYSSELGAFFYEVQVKHALRVFYVPMATFYRFAASLPEPGCRSVLVSSTGRCGSTLVSQIMESHPSVASVSEPYSFLCCAGLMCPEDCRIKGAGAWAAEDPERVTEACWKVQLKDFSAERFVCIKTHSQAVSIVPAVKRLFPKVLHLYLYRDPLKYAASMIRFARAAMPPFVQRFERTFLGRVFMVKVLYPLALPMGYRFGLLGLVSEEMSSAKAARYVCRHASVLAVLAWASNICWGMRLLDAGDASMKSLHYGDLVKHKKDACSRLLDFCSLPSGPAEVDLALAAMAKDSQEQSAVSKSATGEAPVTFDEPGEVDFLNALLRDAGVPCPFNGDLRLKCGLLG